MIIDQRALRRICQVIDARWAMIKHIRMYLSIIIIMAVLLCTDRFTNSVEELWRLLVRYVAIRLYHQQSPIIADPRRALCHSPFAKRRETVWLE